MFVFDTSAYINGRKHHLPIETFPSVWDLIGQRMDDGVIISSSVVLQELSEQDDDIYKWAKARKAAFLEPTAAVQAAAGSLESRMRPSQTRDLADPFVVALAQAEKFTVVTYEGQTFAGVPTKNWDRSMPGICRELGVPCSTLPECLRELGATF